MRFGGHETFTIREGWLHKGLTLLIEQPERLHDAYAADWLGVGQNMAKSIRHWLVATGLATSAPVQKRSHSTARLQATAFGRLIYNHDPYFSERGTWWALHVNLVHTSDHAAAWVWFFNDFNSHRFEKAVCVEGLHRHLHTAGGRLPSLHTLHREITCLLQSYARPVPADESDPEEARECPFRELGLLRYFRTSGSYQLHHGVKHVPPQVFGYALATALPPTRDGHQMVDITMHEATRYPHGPGKAFVLTSESFFEVALTAERDAPEGDIQIMRLASEHVLRIRNKRPLEWLEEYYVGSR